MFESMQEQETNDPWEVNISFWEGFKDNSDVIGGRNASYRHAVGEFEEWDKTQGYPVSCDSSSAGSDYDSDDKDKDAKSQEELQRTTQLVYSLEAGKMVPKLREPRQLYGLSGGEIGPGALARWPAEIQVLPEKVTHVEYIPSEPEPFYQQTGLEKTPMSISSESRGQCVYEYEPIVGNYFLKSRVGGSRNGCLRIAEVDLENDADNRLVFESRFESGNLAKAVKVGEYDYELWLRNDLYTNKHTQWFYFRVANTRKNVNYRFTIVNLMKPDSLYNHGMKPLMYSDKNATSKKIGWVRCGTNIKYYRNNIKYSSGKTDKYYYSLTWTAKMDHDRDTVYFSHCYPYTYSDLQDYLADISTDPVKSKLCKQRVLCHTLAGNLVYLLTITSPTNSTEEAKHRKAVVITSRVHPGESNASWMMKGFLDYLVSNTADAKLLRDTFIFKIVPMLNPDGVIVGNYRCSLAGRDLNRNYKTVLKDSFPSVWYTKNMIKKLSEEREIVAYCDLHGHSRRQNVFIYGCENRGNPQRRLRERIFPVMLSKNAPDKFSYDSCKFKVQKSKEGTGRIVMWNMGIMNSYTMEATFAGSSLGKKKGYHFNTKDFESMGFHFCDTLLDYCDPDNTKCAKILLELEDRLKQEILHHLKAKEGDASMDNINLDQYFSSDLESSDGGSDSSVSDGLPVHLQYTQNKPTPKKKRLKSRKERDKQKVPPQKKTQETPVVPITYTNSKPRPKSKEKNSTPATQPQEKPKQNKPPEGYLEALTNAYLRSGVLVTSEAPKDVPHFRYTAGSGRSADCPHHDGQAFAAQYVANHLQQYKYPGGLQSGFQGGLGVQGRKTQVHAVERKIRDDAVTSILAMTNLVPYAPYTPPSQAYTTQHDDLEDIGKKTGARNKPGSARAIERRMSQKHIVELSAQQQRQLELQQQESQKKEKKEDVDSPIKQHPLPFDQTLEKDKPHDTVKRGTAPSNKAPTLTQRASSASSMSSRIRSARVRRKESLDSNTILGPAQSEADLWDKTTKSVYRMENGSSTDLTSNSQQNVQHNTAKPPKEFLSRPDTRKTKDRVPKATAEYAPTDVKSSSEQQTKKPPTMTNILMQSDDPRATRNANDATPLNQATSQTANHNQISSQLNTHHQPNQQQTTSPSSHRQSKTHEMFSPEREMSDTIKSIHELKEQLLDPAKRVNLSPTTGQFIDHFVRKTEAEISDITSEHLVQDSQQRYRNVNTNAHPGEAWDGGRMQHRWERERPLGTPKRGSGRTEEEIISRLQGCDINESPVKLHNVLVGDLDLGSQTPASAPLQRMLSRQRQASNGMIDAADLEASGVHKGRAQSSSSQPRKSSASPTKISLMISRGHHEGDGLYSGKFHPKPLGRNRPVTSYKHSMPKRL